MVRQWVLVPPFGGSNPSSPARNVKNDPKGRFLDSSLEESVVRTPRLVRTEERSDDVPIPHPNLSARLALVLFIEHIMSQETNYRRDNFQQSHDEQRVVSS